MPTDSTSASSIIRRLKLRHLQALLTIARCGSLTAAAEDLHASQASVSQWLAEIESAFSARLFERGRQLSPTPLLAPVLSLCQRVLDDLERATLELDALRAGQSGKVSIGFQHGVGLSLVPKAVLRIKAELPKLLVELRDDIAATLWPRFLNREHDILVLRLHDRAFAEGIGCEVLFNDVHVVIGAPDHPLARDIAPSWREAAAHPWLLPPTGTALRRCIADTFISAGLVPPPAWIESSAIATNLSMLAGSNMLTVVSLGLARTLAARGDVALLHLTLTSEPGPFGMVWHANSPSPGVLCTLQALRQTAIELA